MLGMKLLTGGILIDHLGGLCAIQSLSGNNVGMIQLVLEVSR